MAVCEICGEKIGAYDKEVVFDKKFSVCLACNSKIEQVLDDKKYNDACIYSTKSCVDSNLLNFNLDIISCKNQELKKIITSGFEKRMKGMVYFDNSECEFCKNHFPPSETLISGEYLYVNESKKLFSVAMVLQKGSAIFGGVHEWNELLDFEVCEDGGSIASGRAGAAAIGAILGGAAGAVIGASMSKKTKKTVDDLHIIISFTDINKPPEVIELINHEVLKGDWEYNEAVKKCNEIVASLKSIIAENESNSNQTQIGQNTGEQKAVVSVSVPDEILKYKNLLDMGAITEEEFEEQKKKLLSLGY